MFTAAVFTNCVIVSRNDYVSLIHFFTAFTAFSFCHWPLPLMFRVFLSVHQPSFFSAGTGFSSNTLWQVAGLGLELLDSLLPFINFFVYVANVTTQCGLELYDGIAQSFNFFAIPPIFGAAAPPVTG